MNAITSRALTVPATSAPKRPKKQLQPTKGESPWYRKSDLMRLFQISDRTVEKWAACGKLPEPVRKGRAWVRWPKSQIDALLAEWQGGAA
jgi:predicted DNA-binding transcriptional regulator AlpA